MSISNMCSLEGFPPDGSTMAETGDKPAVTASPLSLSMRSGGALAKLSLLTPAMTPWQALRQMKELVRSQQRAWYSFSVYERMKLLRQAQTPQQPTCGCCACCCCKNDAQCGKSLCHSSVSTNSCSGDISRHGCMSEAASSVSSIQTPFGGLIGYSGPSGFSPFLPNQIREVLGSNREGSGAASSSPQQRLRSSGACTQHCSNCSYESSTSSGFRAGEDGSASAAETCGGTIGIHNEQGQAPMFIPGHEEARRIIPPAASPLLRFPRVFPGYHFPPQPSAVPSAFFERPGQNKQPNLELDFIPKDDCGPKTAVQLLQCMLADTAAATIQRCIRGYFTRLRYQASLVWRRLLHQQQQREHHAARTLQCAWRCLKAREELMKLRRCRELRIQRNAAAVKIQAIWKMRQQGMLYEIEKLTRVLLAVRSIAAVEIQRVWRGYKTRKVLDEEWNSWVVKWIWDKPSAIVEVVGDFSSPPWTKRHLMKYCYIRKCHVVALPRIVGRHEIKFVVNGRYVCDGSQTVVTDGSGHFNNLVRVRPATQSQFQVIRRRLLEYQSREFVRSASAPAVHTTGELIDSDDSFSTPKINGAYSLDKRALPLQKHNSFRENIEAQRQFKLRLPIKKAEFKSTSESLDIQNEGVAASLVDGIGHNDQHYTDENITPVAELREAFGDTDAETQQSNNLQIISYATDDNHMDVNAISDKLRSNKTAMSSFSLHEDVDSKMEMSPERSNEEGHLDDMVAGLVMSVKHDDSDQAGSSVSVNESRQGFGNDNQETHSGILAEKEDESDQVVVHYGDEIECDASKREPNKNYEWVDLKRMGSSEHPG